VSGPGRELARRLGIVKVFYICKILEQKDTFSHPQVPALTHLEVSLRLKMEFWPYLGT